MKQFFSKLASVLTLAVIGVSFGIAPHEALMRSQMTDAEGNPIVIISTSSENNTDTNSTQNTGGNQNTGNTGGNQNTGNTGGNQNTGNTGGNQNPGPGIDLIFKNPLKADSLQCLVYDIFRIAVNLLAVVAGLFIIYSGFKFVAAQGNPEKLKEARRTFLNTIIGTAIILGAWVIVQFAINTINQFMADDLVSVTNTCE